MKMKRFLKKQVRKMTKKLKEESTMGKIGISSPWQCLYDEIQAMFEKDEDVTVIFSEDTQEIKLYVKDVKKAEALAYFLNQARKFGNVTTTVTVVQPNKAEFGYKGFKEVIEDAFKNNPIFSFAAEYDTPFGKVTFCVFKNMVCQYYCDNMFDLNGFKSTVYEDVARDIFNENVLKNNIHFCTNVPENVDAPLGEWP